MSHGPFLIPSVQNALCPVPYTLCHMPNDKPKSPIHVLGLHFPRRPDPSLPIPSILRPLPPHTAGSVYRATPSLLSLRKKREKKKRGRREGWRDPKEENKKSSDRVQKQLRFPCLFQSSSILLKHPKKNCVSEQCQTRIYQLPFAKQGNNNQDNNKKKHYKK